MSINEYAQKQIDDITNTVNSLKPLVVINCVTYNHEPYIRDALDGFVMQKTNFPFVAIVHDDASTDGTAAIVREYADKYPDIIRPIYETDNQYSKRDGSLSHIMQEARNATGAKYVAMCEGDDYWTDPLKLQKQVDFLESHSDYTMCHSAFEIVDEYSNKLTDDYIDDKIAVAKKSSVVDDYLMVYYQKSKERLPIYQRFMEESRCGERFWFLLVKHNYIITATCVIRKEVIDESRIGYYDYGLFLIAARLGKIGYIKDITSAYRFHPNSAMTNPQLYKEVVLNRCAFVTWGELRRVFDKSTSDDIMSRRGAKKMLVRMIFGMWFNAPEFRKKYAVFLLGHPSIWFDMVRYCVNRKPKIEYIFNISE